jgi:hypothetical protein
MSKDMRICGYFVGPKGGALAKGLDVTWNCCLAFQVIAFRKDSSQNGKKGKLVAFQLDDRPAKDWIVFRRFLIGTKSAGCLHHVFRPSACVNWTDFREI